MSFEQPTLTPNTLEKKSKFSEQSERKQYQLETGEKIAVLAREFSSQDVSGEQNVVFLPGWAMSSESSAVTALGQSFAEKSKAKTYAISSRTEGELGSGDTLLKEAEAISLFIKEKGLKNVVVAGHSQGGDKAIDLVTLLQNDPELRINGLVLLDAVGLYDQKPGSLVKNFIKDALIDAPLTMAKKIVSNPKVAIRGLAAGNAVTQGIFNELKKSGISGGIKRMTEEVKSMAKMNSRLAEVSVPVILMAGTEDPVSQVGKILPSGEEARMTEEWKRKDENEGTSTYIDPREKFLQESMFSQSPYVRMVTPEKLGHHGLPLLRAESIASASLYLLKRFSRRGEKSDTQKEIPSSLENIHFSLSHIEDTLGPLGEDVKRSIQNNI